MIGSVRHTCLPSGGVPLRMARGSVPMSFSYFAHVCQRSNFFVGRSMLAAAFWVAAAGGAIAQQSNAAAEAKQLRLKERDQLDAESQKQRAKGDFDKAIATAEKMLAIEREVFGPVHEDVAGSLEWIERLHLQKDNVTAALKILDERLGIVEKLPRID